MNTFLGSALLVAPYVGAGRLCGKSKSKFKVTTNDIPVDEKYVRAAVGTLFVAFPTVATDLWLERRIVTHFVPKIPKSLAVVQIGAFLVTMAWTLDSSEVKSSE